MDLIKSSSLPFPAQSTKLSALLPGNSIELITTDAPDSLCSEVLTSNRRDSPTLGLLNLPSDLLPIFTEMRPPAISSKAPPIPSILTVTITLESDQSLVTSGNAYSATGTLPLGFTPTTTAAKTLPAPEKNITLSISAGWSSSNKEDSLDQEAGSATHIGPGETVLISSSAPLVLNQDNRGRLVLPLSSTPSSQSRNLAKTEEISDSRLSRITPARLIIENRLILISTDIPEKPEMPLVTATSNTLTSSVKTGSILDQLQRAQPISRKSVGIATGIVSRQRTGVIWIGHETTTNTGIYIELLPRRSQNPEVSYFSDGS
ncbi:hypothetical protein BJX61DRAFT_536970 [Aspergillus egyptiacus]|nr:hypothetical protein BJX61DRAFT_536970 [Aspergillus egyptiacus]